ncbi:hypothetical protein H2198_007348 [Neophaeococcomyces mojaviensis]|uniref:Uncharacterized protein n=1 Tax=Neophaeococcomyces mojaviensis TaxID=3383035 RepID=A0ACC3A0D2_9EURO|nr:hypothetical protein H2198_007348 [Knufia sp. JES_112]
MKALKRGLNNLGNGRSNQQGDIKTLNATKKRNALFPTHTGNSEGAGGQSSGVRYPETQGVPGDNWASPAELNSEQLSQHIQPTANGSQQYDINTPSNDYRVGHRFSFDAERIVPENSQPPAPLAKVSIPSNEASRHNVSESAQSKTQAQNKRRPSAGVFMNGNKDKSLFNHNESALVDDSGPPETPPKTNGGSVIQNHAGNGNRQNGQEPLQPDDGSSPFSDAYESRVQDSERLYREQRRQSNVPPSSPNERNSAARTGYMSQGSATLEPLCSELTIESPVPTADSDTGHDPSAATSNIHSERQRDIAELEATSSKLREAAEQGTQKLKAANKRITELEKDKTTLDNLVQARENSLAELRQKMSGVEAKGRQMSKQLNDVMKELKDTKVALERSRHEHNSVIDRLRKTATEADNASNLNKRYADRVEMLEREKSSLAYRLNDLQPQLKDKQEELEHANRQADCYRRSAQNLQSSNTALTNRVSELDGYLSTADAQCRTLAEQKTKYLNIINDIQPKLTRAKEDLTEKNEEVARLKATQITDRDTAKQRLDACKANLATVRADTEKRIAEAESKATRTIEMWQAEKDKEIGTLKAVHNSELSQLREEHKTATQHLSAQLEGYESKAEREKAEIRTKHQTKLATITEQHETKVAELKARLKDEQAEHQSEILELTDELAAQMVEKAEEYEKATEQLREDVNTLNSRLLTHDDHNFQGQIFAVGELPSSPDELLRSQFSDIVHIVDSLGRIEWKANPSVWTNDILKAVDGRLGNRMLKKAIVQDTVWSVLFRYVFCSPFRMFGAEGEILEQQWASQCDQGSEDDEIFTWPRPGAKAERWRFITVKNCRDTLLPPQPSEWDPRKRVMKDYLKNLHDCRTALIVALENVADLEEESIGHINQLPKKAATIGMNFAMHRCRIVVEMSGRMGLSMADKAAAARNDKIELTRVPALRRYGNVMGVDLDQSQIVGNLAGDQVNVP